MKASQESTQFANNVIAVLELSTRRWRYWDAIYEKSKGLTDNEVELVTGWPRNKIHQEWCLAFNGILFG